MKKKILITGINGFLGSSLEKYLKKNISRQEIYGIDAKYPGSNRKIFKCNLLNKKKIIGIISSVKPDYIFHCAGGRSDSADKLFKDNVMTTKALCDSVLRIRDYNPRIIILGSAAEYGKSKLKNKLIKESEKTTPVSEYGYIKNVQTRLGLLYAKGGLDIVIGRIFNITGFATPSTLSIGRFAERIVRSEKNKRKLVLKTKNLCGKRDFVDIDDVCAALLKLAKRGKKAQVYNICSGKACKIRDMLDKLIRHSKVKEFTLQEDKKANTGSFDVIGSCVKIKKATSWKPKIGIDMSLKNTLLYYRKAI